MNRKFFFFLALMTFCSGAYAQETVGTANPNYVIQPSDVLRMQVFQEPDLTQELRVPQNGMFQFPLIGVVNLKGKTVAEVEDLLRELYDRDYLVNPQINLLILEFSQRRVNVLGAVNQPGPVIFPPEEEMTLLDAISRAGGFNRLARKTAVTLSRTGSDGQVTRFRVNTDELIKDGADSNLWKLEPGDVIFVPERFI
jgi:polysaccharide export outer membrane protein